MKRVLISLVLALVASQVAAGQRIVSIDGAITEIIYQLGAGDRLVAVDSTSVYPAEARQLPDVGYMRALSTEPLLSVQPDSVIASPVAGPAPVFEQLRQAGVAVHIVGGDYSIDGLLQRIAEVARLLDRQARGEALQAELRTQLAALPQPGSDKPARVLFLMAVQSGQWLAAGQGTLADAMLAMLGAGNVIDHHGYKPLAMESLVSLDPDAVILVSNDAAVPVPAAVNHLRAARQQQVLQADVSELLVFGPRLPAALRQIANVLYR